MGAVPGTTKHLVATKDVTVAGFAGMTVKGHLSAKVRQGRQERRQRRLAEGRRHQRSGHRQANCISCTGPAGLPVDVTWKDDRVVDHQESGGAPPEREQRARGRENRPRARCFLLRRGHRDRDDAACPGPRSAEHGGSNAELGAPGRALALPSYFPFLLSFVVVATFWFSHHNLFGKLRRLNGRLLRINMGTLLMIVLLPFVTRVLGASRRLHNRVRSSTPRSSRPICFLMACDLLRSRVAYGLLRPGCDRTCTTWSVGVWPDRRGLPRSRSRSRSGAPAVGRVVVAGAVRARALRPAVVRKRLRAWRAR